MFTKEDYKLWLNDKYNIELNKRMIEYFPFLLPRNRWTGLVSSSYDYSYNEMRAMPDGWAIAFGYEMLCELREELFAHGFLYDYRIIDIKEKYGLLRWYDSGITENGYEIIRKYERLSYETCIYCGESVTHETYGWINYVCGKCFNEHELSGHLIGEGEEDEEDK